MEEVFAIPRAYVAGATKFTGLRRVQIVEVDALLAAADLHGRYLARSIAEESPAWKQLIPYVVVRDGEQTFLMERTEGGGDARLHRKASIGVGGHLNPVDRGEDPLMAGLRREWAEEIDADWEPEFELIGLLNDDSNPVGAVHLGVVFTVEAKGRPLHVRETEKLSGRMASREDVRAAWDRLETWSQLVATELLGVRGGA